MERNEHRMGYGSYSNEEWAYTTILKKIAAIRAQIGIHNVDNTLANPGMRRHLPLACCSPAARLPLAGAASCAIFALE